mmetsp:Transcript_29531/g.81169  ORF Transcript_29531/g.81169 Transcript_29531/m.81169 type:complete len:395 (-) Transcript_29531:697-1881(-)
MPMGQTNGQLVLCVSVSLIGCLPVALDGFIPILLCFIIHPNLVDFIGCGGGCGWSSRLGRCWCHSTWRRSGGGGRIRLSLDCFHTMSIYQANCQLVLGIRMTLVGCLPVAFDSIVPILVGFVIHSLLINFLCCWWSCRWGSCTWGSSSNFCRRSTLLLERLCTVSMGQANCQFVLGIGMAQIGSVPVALDGIIPILFCFMVDSLLINFVQCGWSCRLESSGGRPWMILDCFHTVSIGQTNGQFVLCIGMSQIGGLSVALDGIIPVVLGFMVHSLLINIVGCGLDDDGVLGYFHRCILYTGRRRRRSTIFLGIRCHGRGRLQRKGRNTLSIGPTRGQFVLSVGMTQRRRLPIVVDGLFPTLFDARPLTTRFVTTTQLVQGIGRVPKRRSIVRVGG